MRRGLRELAVALAGFVVAGGIVAAIAAAHVLETPKGRPIGGQYHRFIHQAKAPLVDGAVRLDFGACPGHSSLAACVYSNHPRTIHMRRGLNDPRGVLYHELGHVFDFLVLNRAERRRFKRIMRLRVRRWYRGDPAPAEWFADGYGVCARRGPVAGSRARRTIYGYRPSRRQHADVCRLISDAADAGGDPPQPPRRPPPTISEPPPQLPPADPPVAECAPLAALLGVCR